MLLKHIMIAEVVSAYSVLTNVWIWYGMFFRFTDKERAILPNAGYPGQTLALGFFSVFKATGRSGSISTLT